MTSEQSAWKNIPNNTPETGDIARKRLAVAFEKDPFVRMLAPEIRGCMVEAFGNALIFDKPHHNHVVSGYHSAIKTHAKPVLKTMPLGFLTEGFIDHVLSLVAFTIMPHPEYDGWGEPK